MSDTVKFVKFNTLSLRKTFDTETGEYALFSWGIRAGYPRIIVYTSNMPWDKRDASKKFDYNTMITAPFDHITLGIMLDKLRKIIRGDKDSKESVDCYNAKFENGVKTNQVVVQARFTIGKDKDGVIYLAATTDGKRKVKFELAPSDTWFKFYDKNNDQVTDKGILSMLYADSYLNKLTKLMDAEMVKDFTQINNIEPKTKQTVSNTVKTTGDLDLGI